MFTIKTIENPKFKNCHAVNALCGAAYEIKAVPVSDVLQEEAPKDNVAMSPTFPKENKEYKESDLSRFFDPDDEFENIIAYTNRVFGGSEDA